MSAVVDDSSATVVGSLMSAECCEDSTGAEVGAIDDAEEDVAAAAEVEAGTDVGGSAGIDVVMVAGVDAKFLTGSGVELTRVKWLELVFWAPVGGPLVVGEWLRDRVRLKPCRLGDVLRALAVPVPLAAAAAPEPWWLSRESIWFCV
jgi:hypothetical protein